MASPSSANACTDLRARGADNPIVELAFDPCQLSDNRLEKLTIGSCNPAAALRGFRRRKTDGMGRPLRGVFGTARRTSPQAHASAFPATTNLAPRLARPGQHPRPKLCLSIDLRGANQPTRYESS